MMDDMTEEEVSFIMSFMLNSTYSYGFKELLKNGMVSSTNSERLNHYHELSDRGYFTKAPFSKYSHRVGFSATDKLVEIFEELKGLKDL
jgi:hypothetical protein